MPTNTAAELEDLFQDAFAARDKAGIAALCEDDAVLVTPGGDELRGKPRHCWPRRGVLEGRSGIRLGGHPGGDRRRSCPGGLPVVDVEARRHRRRPRDRRRHHPSTA